MKWTGFLLFALITFSAHAQSVTPPPRDWKNSAPPEGVPTDGRLRTTPLTCGSLSISAITWNIYAATSPARPLPMNGLHSTSSSLLDRDGARLTGSEFIRRRISRGLPLPLKTPAHHRPETPHRAVLWPTY